MRPRPSAARSRSSAAAVAVACAAAFGGCSTDCDEFVFDGKKWNARGEEYHRADQTAGLLDCGWLVGKTRGQIRAGLGRANFKHRATWSYVIGPSGFSGTAYLELDFDRGGRVRRAFVPDWEDSD